MCVVCGCNEAQSDSLETTVHSHHHYGHSEAGVSVPGLNNHELIEIEQNILSKDDGYAASNRAYLESRGSFALNLVSSPGAGKTTLLIETFNALKILAKNLPVAVIEGDQETSNDADRIRETGVAAIQINTGRGCHLDAHMVGHALGDLNMEDNSVVFIENVGNLVCPAAFDLGERAKVVILSVTEGDDKPLKYPDMFAVAEVMLLSKIDLLPYVDFDVDKAMERALRINPNLHCILCSSKEPDGLNEWVNWICNTASASNISSLEPNVISKQNHA